MATYARLNSKYIGVDPGIPKIVYANRDAGGPWEELKITKRERWSDLLAIAANRQIGVDEATRNLVTRSVGDIGGWGGQWDVSADGKTATCDRWTLALEGHHVSTPLSPLRVSQRDFVNAAGERYTVVGSTELMLAWRYDMEGADAIRPVLEQRHSLGFNNLRWLWQDYNNIGRPWQMPLDKMGPALALAAEYGFYVQGTILADCQLINPNEGDQQRRVQDQRAATAGIVNLVEQLGNEYGANGNGDTGKNGFNPWHFPRPTDRLAANASSTEGGKDAPYWDFFCFSGRRGPAQAAIREYGPVEFMYADGRPWGGVPAICDEGMKPGKDSGDPRDFERAGGQARSGCGGRLHTDAGTAGNSRLFNDLEIACAQAFVRGLKG